MTSLQTGSADTLSPLLSNATFPHNPAASPGSRTHPSLPPLPSQIHMPPAPPTTIPTTAIPGGFELPEWPIPNSKITPWSYSSPNGMSIPLTPRALTTRAPWSREVWPIAPEMETYLDFAKTDYPESFDDLFNMAGAEGIMLCGEERRKEEMEDILGRMEDEHGYAHDIREIGPATPMNLKLGPSCSLVSIVTSPLMNHRTTLREEPPTLDSPGDRRSAPLFRIPSLVYIGDLSANTPSSGQSSNIDFLNERHVAPIWSETDEVPARDEERERRFAEWLFAERQPTTNKEDYRTKASSPPEPTSPTTHALSYAAMSHNSKAKTEGSRRARSDSVYRPSPGPFLLRNIALSQRANSAPPAIFVEAAREDTQDVPDIVTAELEASEEVLVVEEESKELAQHDDVAYTSNIADVEITDGPYLDSLGADSAAKKKHDWSKDEKAGILEAAASMSTNSTSGPKSSRRLKGTRSTFSPPTPIGKPAVDKNDVSTEKIASGASKHDATESASPSLDTAILDRRTDQEFPGETTKIPFVKEQPHTVNLKCRRSFAEPSGHAAIRRSHKMSCALEPPLSSIRPSKRSRTAAPGSSQPKAAPTIETEKSLRRASPSPDPLDCTTVDHADYYEGDEADAEGETDLEYEPTPKITTVKRSVTSVELLSSRKSRRIAKSDLKTTLKPYSPAEDAAILELWDGIQPLTKKFLEEAAIALNAKGFKRTTGGLKYRMRNSLREEFKKKAMMGKKGRGKRRSALRVRQE